MRAVVIGLGVLMIASACSSGETTLDADKLERDIKSSLQRSNRVSAVDCPDGVKLEKGSMFTCTARVEGKRQIIEVELTSRDKVVFEVKS